MLARVIYDAGPQKHFFSDCNSFLAALKPVLYRHVKGRYETRWRKHSIYMSFFKKSVSRAVLFQGTVRIISQREGACQLFFGEGGVGGIRREGTHETPL